MIWYLFQKNAAVKWIPTLPQPTSFPSPPSLVFMYSSYGTDSYPLRSLRWLFFLSSAPLNYKYPKASLYLSAFSTLFLSTSSYYNPCEFGRRNSGCYINCWNWSIFSLHSIFVNSRASIPWLCLKYRMNPSLGLPMPPPACGSGS